MLLFKQVKDQFKIIRESLRHKCYRDHVVNRFYAVENSLDDFEDREVRKKDTEFGIKK